MDLTNVILATENRKGSEVNYLMTLVDFISLLIDTNTSPEDMAELIDGLYQTKTTENDWISYYWHGNHSLDASFCHDRKMLTDFVTGYYNRIDDGKDPEWIFDPDECSRDCMDIVEELKEEGVLHG